ncbi:hypothetical protein Tco_1380322, partial [Tanacetum coccineum]
VRRVSQLIIGSGITGGDNSSQKQHHMIDGINEIIIFLMDRLLKEVLMIDELSIIETDKVNHTVEMDMLKLVVEVECFGKCVDEFDKVTVLFGEMQLKQEDRSYAHASNELHLYVVHVVPSKHEADQHW